MSETADGTPPAGPAGAPEPAKPPEIAEAAETTQRAARTGPAGAPRVAGAAVPAAAARSMGSAAHGRPGDPVPAAAAREGAPARHRTDGTPRRHAAALWVAEAGKFRGCAFHLGDGLVVSAAHVVLDAGPLSVVGADGAAYPVADVRATPAAAPGGTTRFHPFPDLALLTVPGCAKLPAVRPAATDPAPGTAVTALGHSPDTPSPGIQPDTLSLRVGDASGAYLRVLGDGVREGFSGSMLVADDTGLVVGVLKGSRSFRHVQGGWFTPVTALRDFLGPRLPSPGADDAAPGSGPEAVSPPTDAELVDALLAFPALARADHRYDLLDRMGHLLGLPHSFEVEERSGRREHLYRLVLSCRQYRDERAALRSLYTAMEETAPYDKALDRLRALVGRVVGSGEDA